jgi:hypothetical protein
MVKNMKLERWQGQWILRWMEGIEICNAVFSTITRAKKARKILKAGGIISPHHGNEEEELWMRV